MLVFGDADDVIDPRQRLAEIAGGSLTLPQLIGESPAWRATELFLDAAQLAQGLTEIDFADCGEDRESPLRRAAATLVLAAARLLAGRAESRTLAEAVAALSQAGLPRTVTAKRPEGYAFYALYPEAYLEAAIPLRGQRATVIGIRSIGLGLAALVAATVGDAELLSVRPVGPPFRRELRLAPAYRDRLVGGESLRVVADEGPGLSGSSFAAVLDTLAAGGVAEKRVHLFPSHLGAPGPEATAEAAERWPRLQRHVVSFDELFLGGRPRRQPLAAWFTDLLGPPVAPVEDISGGAWRGRRAWGGQPPPAHLQQERRKFLLHTPKGTFLLKFVGLGRAGRAAAERAAQLAEAGFSPPVFGFRHGFLAERWVAGTPLPAAGLPRARLVAHLARYLAFRAGRCPAAEGAGASPEALGEMLVVNGTEALGPEAASALRRLAAHRPDRQPRRVMTDNRLHAWEWLVTAHGQLVKTDAIDHCAAHDLIGCQEITWDIAAAGVEFGLSEAERRELVAGVEEVGGIPVDREVLAFHEPCYLAFQLGYYSMAAATLSGVPAEQRLLAQRAAFYREALAASLALNGD
ncbi:MAG TPA: hypothetical protein VHB23_00075 [Devosiaceae bacterium]|nr:hypothetical protein [Devosiaceae bacterium]